MATQGGRSTKRDFSEVGLLSSSSHSREDMEEFLKAYEKPAQLYRFLQARHAVKPIFLQRTLSYMQHRNSRRGRKRVRPLRVDDLATDVQDLPDLAEEIVSDTRLEIDLQSIAECSDFIEAPTNGSCDSASCDSGSCDLEKGTKYQQQQVEVEVFSYKFSQRERKPLNTLLPIYNTKSLGKCVVTTVPSGSHDHNQQSHETSKISIPASELTWKKSPGISGTHMLVFKCRPLKTHVPKATINETPAPVLQPDLKPNQPDHETESTLSNGCNGIDTKETDSIFTHTSENCFVKKGTNGVNLHDNHRSTLNGCTTTFAHMDISNYPPFCKEMESYKIFKNRLKMKNNHHKKKNKRRSALDLLIAESRQFRNNTQPMSEDESSRDSFADDSNLDEDEEIEFSKNYIVDHSYAKTANGEWEEPSAKRPRMMADHEPLEMLRGVCSAELVVFDSRNKCLLQDGQYELVLQDCDLPSSPPVGSPLSWDTIFGNNNLHMDGGAHSQKHFSLKFSLNWSNGIPTVRQQYEQRTAMELTKLRQDYETGKDVVTQLLPSPGHINPITLQQSGESQAHPPVVYNFHYHGNSHLQTEARHSMRCPWCSMDCGYLYSLLCHLTLCHPRLTSVYTPLRDGSLIDIHITNSSPAVPRLSLTDGLQTSSSGKFYRKKPARTELMLYRAGVPYIENLNVFMAPPSEVGGRKNAVLHNRVYYHTTSVFPYSALDAEDSETEDTPSWLSARTAKMIDEFTDVNEGEKELMKLWNLFMDKKRLLADQQVPGACLEFVSRHKQLLKERNLVKNFIQHLVNLQEFQLISPSVFHQATSILLESHSTNDNSPDSR